MSQPHAHPARTPWLSCSASGNRARPPAHAPVDQPPLASPSSSPMIPPTHRPGPERAARGRLGSRTRPHSPTAEPRASVSTGHRGVALSCSNRDTLVCSFLSVCWHLSFIKQKCRVSAAVVGAL